jgi:DNA-binding NtrC family response regulator
MRCSRRRVYLAEGARDFCKRSLMSESTAMEGIARANEKQATILVLDDEATLRRIMADEFEKAGYSVVHFPDKEDGLKWIHHHDVDLVVSDIKSPRMDGFAFLKLLRSDPSTSGIPCIFVTGMADLKIAIEAVSLGVSDYLVKPVDLTDLMRAVRKALGQT